MGQNGLERAAIRRASAHAQQTRWFAVQCQPNRENAAAEHLRRQHYSVFLPRQRRAIRHARRIETVLRPFFPGYLFVELDTATECWRPINSTFGVAHLVMAGERPAPAPVGIIEELRAAFDDAGIYDGAAALVAGQRVRVVSGPFADLCGELVRLDARARVRVLLDVLGGSVPALLARGAVAPEDGFY
jgi:transcriptional antiterminator RfaH